MKKIFTVIAIAAAFFCSCKSQEKKQEKEEKKISKRDNSITKENAYNDLFLDSADVVKYITDNAIPDSISHRIISFYNTRNY